MNSQTSVIFLSEDKLYQVWWIIESGMLSQSWFKSPISSLHIKIINTLWSYWKYNNTKKNYVWLAHAVSILLFKDFYNLLLLYFSRLPYIFALFYLKFFYSFINGLRILSENACHNVPLPNWYLWIYFFY